MSEALAGRRIVITGASRGIGRAVAQRVLAEGARVVINGRDERALAETASALHEDIQGEFVVSAGSVGEFGYAEALISTCVDYYGGIDVLINCAGIAEPAGTSILDIDSGDWQELIDVHLTGTFNTCRNAAPLMARQGYGAIINTSSHAFLGLYGGTGYAASKGGTNSLSLAMANDLAEKGVDVNVVCPGAKTRLSTGDDFVAQIERLHRRGSLSDERRASALNPASPDYVASLYAALASVDMAGVSGRMYWGSGGYMGTFSENEQAVLCAMDHTADDAQPMGTAQLSALLLAGQS
ncbi:MAG: SDR family NAD(P)-dependent oxidoreductase [Halioglobus sp.]